MINPMNQQASSHNKKIVFFDGLCNLCNWSVEFLIHIDKKNSLYFSTQQGELFNSPLIQNLIRLEPNQSIIFCNNNTLFYKSNAVIQILAQVGGAWKLAYLLLIIPRPLRDFCYDIVAQKRYQWFGKRQQCRLPTEKERTKFLN